MTAKLVKAREILLRRIWLFVRIVWRVDQSETRMKPKLAWEVSGIIWPQASLTEADRKRAGLPSAELEG